MKNDNDLILERMRGVPMQKGAWKDKFHPQNPNRAEANDNDPRRGCPWKCPADSASCLCVRAERETAPSLPSLAPKDSVKDDCQ